MSERRGCLIGSPWHTLRRSLPSRIFQPGELPFALCLPSFRDIWESHRFRLTPLPCGDLATCGSPE